MNKQLNSQEIQELLNQNEVDGVEQAIANGMTLEELKNPAPLVLSPEFRDPIPEVAPVIDNTAENVQKQVPVIDNKTVQSIPPVVDNSNNPNIGPNNSNNFANSELTRSQELMKMYKDLQGTSDNEISDARNKDIMLNLVGSLGDNLTTYLNASGEKSAKTGAGVQAGKGGADFASKLATNAQEALVNNKARQEALLRQYQEMARGERQTASLEAKEKLAEQSRKLEERRVAAYEAQVAKSGKSAEKGITPYQELRLEEQRKKEAKLSDKQTTELEGLSNVLRSLGEVKEVKQGVNTGRYASAIQSGKDLLPFAEPNQNFVKLKQMSGTQLFDYVKAQSGVSYSAKELAQLKDNMPTSEDDDKTFITKLGVVDDMVKRKQEEKLKAFSAQGKNVEPFKDSNVSPKSKKTVNQNGNLFDAETGEFLGKAK